MSVIHVLASEDGQFLGELEQVSENRFDFWSETGIDTSFTVYYTGDDRFRELEDLVASELGLSPEDVYLTDEDETEILW